MRSESTALATERVERKLAAILAADIAGYSRLMGADEEGTLARLKSCRVVIDGLIAAHRGRIFRTTRAAAQSLARRLMRTDRPTKAGLDQFATDSLLEEEGFEPSVPP